MNDERYQVSDFDEDVAKRKVIIEEAKELDLEQDWNTVAPVILKLRRRWKQIEYWESAYEDELAAEFDSVIDAFYAKRNEGLQGIQTMKEELIKRAQELSTSSDWNKVTSEMDELMSQWKAAGNLGKEVDDTLWEKFNAARQTFFDRKKENWQNRQNKIEDAKKVKQELIVKAKSLVESTDWNKTSNALGKLMEDWKAAGFSGKDTEDSLWNEFNEVRQKFYDARTAAYDEIRAKEEENASAKRAVISEAEAIAAKKEYSKENTEAMKLCTTKWKEIGHSGRNNEDDLWKAFRKANDDYFEGMRAYNDQKHADWVKRMQETRARKVELLQKQQRQLRYMEQEVSSILSQSAADEMMEDIEDKKEFIKQLEEELVDLDKKMGK